jgi:hypothetical protein
MYTNIYLNLCFYVCKDLHEYIKNIMIDPIFFVWYTSYMEPLIQPILFSIIEWQRWTLLRVLRTYIYMYVYIHIYIYIYTYINICIYMLPSENPFFTTSKWPSFCQKDGYQTHPDTDYSTLLVPCIWVTFLFIHMHSVKLRNVMI